MPVVFGQAAPGIGKLENATNRRINLIDKISSKSPDFSLVVFGRFLNLPERRR
jgi:hypothetical protein